MPALPSDDARRVTTSHALLASGVSRRQIAAQLSGGRWQRVGHALVMHNGPLSRDQRWKVARIHAGPQALLAAFTAAEAYGLRGWERDVVHVLAPGGTRLRTGCPVPVRLHLHGKTEDEKHPARGVQSLPAALVRAAATFDSPRPACAILAAGVQQRLLTPNALSTSLENAPRTRHRAALLAACDDIAQGAQALSEIDFVRLCRRAGLPPPQQQCVRREPSGRRRYLDATWRRRDGLLVIVEVDGALHLTAKRWWDDQIRQNELALADALVLRFPSVVVRTQPDLVVDQLRRALLVP